MSWTSPLTVPIRNLPTGLDAGLGQQRPQHAPCAPGHRPAGDQHLGHEEVAALEPGADLLERGDEARRRAASRGSMPMLQALLGQLEHARARCRPASRRRGPGGSPRGGHAAPSFVRRVRLWSRAGRGAAEPRAPRLIRVGRARRRPALEPRWSGPEMPRAATTSPRVLRGPATAIAGQPDLELVDGGGVAASRAVAQRRARARRGRQVAGAALEPAVGTGSAPQAGTPCRARRCGRTSTSVQSRVPRRYWESTWATWTTRSPRAPRGGRSRRSLRRAAPATGRASRTSSSHGSCRAAYSRRMPAGVGARVAVALEQAAALERGEQPRGRCDLASPVASCRSANDSGSSASTTRTSRCGGAVERLASRCCRAHATAARRSTGSCRNRMFHD